MLRGRRQRSNFQSAGELPEMGCGPHRKCPLEVHRLFSRADSPERIATAVRNGQSQRNTPIPERFRHTNRSVHHLRDRHNGERRRRGVGMRGSVVMRSADMLGRAMRVRWNNSVAARVEIDVRVFHHRNSSLTPRSGA